MFMMTVFNAINYHNHNMQWCLLNFQAMLISESTKMKVCVLT